jgi:membrane fusion protein (multidrug efflux system)
MYIRIMKKWIPWVLFAGLLGLLLYSKFSKEAPKGPGGPGAGKGSGAPLPIESYIVRQDTLAENVSLSGTLLPMEQVQVSAEASGKVVSVHFTEGQAVAAGQLLLRLNDADLQAQLRKAEKQLALAEITEKRLKALLQKAAVSQEEYDQASTQVQVWQSEVQLLQAQLSKLEVRAPFAGMIGLRKVSPGAYLSPGTAVATLASTGVLKLEFDLPEQYAVGTLTGRQVQFTTAGLAGTHEGRVYAIEPEIDPQTRALRMRAWVTNAGGSLRAGAFASIRMPRQAPQLALLIPTQAVIPSEQGARVFVVQADTLAPRPVVLGLRTQDKVQVLSGLQAGEQVLATGVLQARPGLRVAAKPTNR